jgi:hypothetical protein
MAVSLASIGSVAAHSLGLLHGAGEGFERLGKDTEAAHATAGQVPLPVGVLAAVVLTWLASRVWSGPPPAGAAVCAGMAGGDGAAGLGVGGSG